MFKFIKNTALFLSALAIFFSALSSGQASAATCYNIPANIRPGDKTADVRMLQNFLIESGYLRGNADGAYGPLTKEAVLAFQQSRNLVSNPAGFVGAGTRQQIRDISCGTSTPLANLPLTNPAVAINNTSPSYQQTQYLQPNVSTCQPGMLFNIMTGLPCVNANSVVQYTSVPGCTGTNLFSTVTGRRCADGPQAPVTTTLPPGCAVGANFSITTGLPCSNFVDPWDYNLNNNANNSISGRPDLTISNVLCSPVSPAVNESVSCTITVYNAGRSGIDQPFGISVNGNYHSVTSSMSAYSSRTITVPNAFSLGYGTTTVTFAVDSNNTVEEENEGNNVHTRTFHIQPLAPVDLTQNYSTPACPYTFSSTLELGSRGQDVIALQNFLKKFGFYAGNSHGSFDNATKLALTAYQANRSISPADGSFGASTRASVNASCASGSTSVSISGNLRLELGSTEVYKKTPARVAWYSSNNVIPQNNTMTMEVFRVSDNQYMSVKDTGRFNATVGSVTIPASLPAGQYKLVVSTTVAGTVHKAETPAFTVPEATAVFAKPSNPTIAVTGTTAATKGLTAEFKLSMLAKGVDIPLLAANDITVVFINPNGNTISADSVTVATDPRKATASGSTAQVTITAKISGSKLITSGSYRAELKAVRWGSATEIANFSGTYVTPTGVQYP